jgi:hypothetical protein
MLRNNKPVAFPFGNRDSLGIQLISGESAYIFKGGQPLDYAHDNERDQRSYDDPDQSLP